MTLMAKTQLFHSVLAMNNGNYQSRAVDVKDNNNNDIGYGWNNIRGRAGDNTGWMNAGEGCMQDVFESQLTWTVDSLAYFACLASLQKKLGWTTQGDGTLLA
jgi:hypothetical protein